MILLILYVTKIKKWSIWKILFIKYIIIPLGIARAKNNMTLLIEYYWFFHKLLRKAILIMQSEMYTKSVDWTELLVKSTENQVVKISTELHVNFMNLFAACINFNYNIACSSKSNKKKIVFWTEIFNTLYVSSKLHFILHCTITSSNIALIFWNTLYEYRIFYSYILCR